MNTLTTYPFGYRPDNKKCPKCDVLTYWAVKYIAPTEYEADEWLHVTCANCGYVFRTNTKSKIAG